MAGGLMTRILLAASLLSASIAASTPAVANQKGATIANPDALIQQDFQKRIYAYIALRNNAVKGIGPLKTTTNPAEIKAGEAGLAARIATARSDAKPGDIFTPEIRQRFRDLLAPHLKGEDGRDAKAIVKDDAPPAVPFKVNASYPEGKSFPTVPAKLLVNLPPLPKQVEYRIIDKHLILRDTEANLIVDYMLNAIR
jgi:hypothetical protein